ncbi:MAG: hypothetical protein AB8B91_12490 [Rubripirellula sp.]
MRKLTVCALITFGFAFVSETQAAQKAPFYELACQYELDVKVFDRLVSQVRGIDRNDEQLVGRLETAAKRLRLAAKNPRHQNRLISEWKNVQKFHAQVEERIFTKYTPHHDLIRSWEATIYSYSHFSREVFYQIENPRHGNSVRKIKYTNTFKNRYYGISSTATGR